MTIKKVSCYVKPCVRISANYEDFDGGNNKAEKWRMAYFEMLTWKNTWSVPITMDINSRRNENGYYIPFVTMLVNEDKKEQAISFMEDFGYRNIKAYPENVLLVDSTEGFYAFGNAFPSSAFFDDEVE